MAARSDEIQTLASPSALAQHYREVRAQSLLLCATMQPDDYVVQSMPSASPAKWHLAHTSWFFESFVLEPHKRGYSTFDEQYAFLFNSYYYTVGNMHDRPRRGLLTRPTTKEIFHYRSIVDEAVLELLDTDSDPRILFLVELGLHHEQQHQELMLTDIKHAFSSNPLKPALIEATAVPSRTKLPDFGFVTFQGGEVEIGANREAFCFDNETPRHRTLLKPFEFANRTVTNSEFRAFIDAGGYRQPEFWLSDGWAWVQQENILRPLYWSEDHQAEFTLTGMQDIDPDAPVCHLSFYEADAFARFAGARLPTEAEWESAATQPVEGHFMDRGQWHPERASGQHAGTLAQIFGDTWEWTASPYSPYPGFRPLSGSLGEYNGKFMCNQMVCRGGSCVTPPGHVRASYRNFFYPHECWQFFGLRLARDI